MSNRVNIAGADVSSSEPTFDPGLKNALRLHGKDGMVRRPTWFGSKVTVQGYDTKGNMCQFCLNKGSLINFIIAQQKVVTTGTPIILKKGCFDIGASSNKKVLEAFSQLYPDAVTKQEKVDVKIADRETSGLNELFSRDIKTLPFCREKYLTDALRKKMTSSIMRGVDANGYPYFAIRVDMAKAGFTKKEGVFILRKEKRRNGDVWHLYKLMEEGKGLKLLLDKPLHMLKGTFHKSPEFTWIQTLASGGNPSNTTAKTVQMV